MEVSWWHQQSHSPEESRGDGAGSGGRAEAAPFPSPVQLVLPPLLWDAAVLGDAAGKGLGVSAVSCPGVFQLQRGCWVDLCVFEGVFESVSPGQGHPLEKGGQGTCEGKSSGE